MDYALNPSEYSIPSALSDNLTGSNVATFSEEDRGLCLSKCDDTVSQDTTRQCEQVPSSDVAIICKPTEDKQLSRRPHVSEDKAVENHFTDQSFSQSSLFCNLDEAGNSQPSLIGINRDEVRPAQLSNSDQASNVLSYSTVYLESKSAPMHYNVEDGMLLKSCLDFSPSCVEENLSPKDRTSDQEFLTAGEYGTIETALPLNGLREHPCQRNDVSHNREEKESLSFKEDSADKGRKLFGGSEEPGSSKTVSMTSTDTSSAVGIPGDICKAAVQPDADETHRTELLFNEKSTVGISSPSYNEVEFPYRFSYVPERDCCSQGSPERALTQAVIPEPVLAHTDLEPNNRGSRAQNLTGEGEHNEILASTSFWATALLNSLKDVMELRCGKELLGSSDDALARGAERITLCEHSFPSRHETLSSTPSSESNQTETAESFILLGQLNTVLKEFFGEGCRTSQNLNDAPQLSQQPAASRPFKLRNRWQGRTYAGPTARRINLWTRRYTKTTRNINEKSELLNVRQKHANVVREAMVWQYKAEQEREDKDYIEEELNNLKEELATTRRLLAVATNAAPKTVHTPDAWAAPKNPPSTHKPTSCPTNQKKQRRRTLCNWRGQRRIRARANRTPCIDQLLAEDKLRTENTLLRTENLVLRYAVESNKFEKEDLEVDFSCLKSNYGALRQQYMDIYQASITCVCAASRCGAHSTPTASSTEPVCTRDASIDATGRTSEDEPTGFEPSPSNSVRQSKEQRPTSSTQAERPALSGTMQEVPPWCAPPEDMISLREYNSVLRGIRATVQSIIFEINRGYETELKIKNSDSSMFRDRDLDANSYESYSRRGSRSDRHLLLTSNMMDVDPSTRSMWLACISQASLLLEQLDDILIPSPVPGLDRRNSNWSSSHDLLKGIQVSSVDDVEYEGEFQGLSFNSEEVYV